MDSKGLNPQKWAKHGEFMVVRLCGGDSLLMVDQESKRAGLDTEERYNLQNLT